MCESRRLGADTAGTNLFSSSTICHCKNESSWASSGRGDSDKYKLPARAQLTSTLQSTQSCKNQTWSVRLSSVQQDRIKETQNSSLPAPTCPCLWLGATRP
jgi:hypothetical protein